MTILVIEFFALIVICYVFFVYATKNRVSKKNGKAFPLKTAGVAILILITFIWFASWYVRLGLAS